jgi:uncharacterized RDD family membrane protein YckC
MTPPGTRPSTSAVEDARPAGLGRRALAMLYDALAVIALWMLATAVIVPFADPQPRALRDPLFTAWLVLVWFAYLGWCWRRGMTLGLRAWKLEIVDEGGGAIGWGRCAVRFAVSWLSAAALLAGFWWAWFDPHRRCWHDRASGTRVVRRPG